MTLVFVFLQLFGVPTAAVPSANAPHPKVLAADAGPWSPLAVDDTGLYYVDNSRTLKRITLDGKTAEKIVADADAIQIALDATSVFWTEAERVARAPKRPGSEKQLLMKELYFPYGITARGANIFFTTQGPDPKSHEADGGVSRLPKAGGAVEDLLAAETVPGE